MPVQYSNVNKSRRMCLMLDRPGDVGGTGGTHRKEVGVGVGNRARKPRQYIYYNQRYECS